MKIVNYTKPLYNVWNGMKKRCHSRTDKAYKWYGARGIRVCDEWRYSFLAFEAWALKNGYRPGLTIERKDVNKGYEPGNCTFIPNEEQNRNTTKNVKITVFGETKTLVEWSEDKRCKVSYQTLHSRVRRRKADPEWSITTPIHTGNGIKTACKRGHPFTEENTYYDKGNGSRHCRICIRGYYSGKFE